jgi:hypothetical protein
MFDSSDQPDKSSSRRKQTGRGLKRIGRGLWLGFRGGVLILWLGFRRGGPSVWGGLKRTGQGFWGVATQSGWRDIYISAIGTIALLAPLLVTLLIGRTLGVGVVEDVLCSTGQTSVSASQLIALGLGLIMSFFVMKFLIYGMAAIDETGISDTETQDVVYSFVAAVMPIIIPLFLQKGGISIVSCLYP